MALINPENITVQAEGFGSLPVLRQLGLMVGLSASIALGIAIVMWAQSPNYTVLFGNVSPKDSSLIMDELQKADIPFKLDNKTGTVMVASGKVQEARLKLATLGLPKGNGNGFELLDQQEKFGISQFMEKARYQRALEGELARTISTLKNVKSARVHLAIPKQSAFVRNKEAPSASVVVNLYSGRGLVEDQIQAIVHMVASSITGMDSRHISVIDQNGQLLTSSGSQQGMVDASQLNYKKKLEEVLVNRIEAILTPIVGVGSVKAQVASEIDFTFTEQTQETYNPDLVAIRSEQTSEETGSGANAASGVPGALTNQPPPAGTVAGPGTAAGETLNESGKSTRRRSTRNYELDKTISHTKLAAGNIHKLSVAVLVDDSKTFNEDGEVTRTPRDEQALARMTTLVKDAIGFDAHRGDTVNVINSTFSVPQTPEALPEIPVWEQSWVWDIVKQAVGVLMVLVLIFGVLKPVLRELAAKGILVQRTLGAGGLLEGSTDAAGQIAIAGGQQALGNQASPTSHRSSDIDAHIVTAKALASQDPKKVAQVVKNWTDEDSSE